MEGETCCWPRLPVVPVTLPGCPELGGCAQGAPAAVEVTEGAACGSNPGVPGMWPACTAVLAPALQAWGRGRRRRLRRPGGGSVPVGGAPPPHPNVLAALLLRDLLRDRGQRSLTVEPLTLGKRPGRRRFPRVRIQEPFKMCGAGICNWFFWGFFEVSSESHKTAKSAAHRPTRPTGAVTLHRWFYVCCGALKTPIVQAGPAQIAVSSFSGKNEKTRRLLA